MKKYAPRGILTESEMADLFPPSHEELLKIWNQQRFVCAFLIIKDSGLRPGELRALKWRDWYSEIMCFPIMHGIEAGTTDKENNTKTGKARVALMSRQTAQEIEILRDMEQSLPEQFIFRTKQGKPIQGHTITSAFHAGLRRAGLNKPDATPYWLRHTFDTRALEMLPFDIVRRLMGHTDIATTLYYRNQDVESLLREAMMLRKLTSGRETIELQLFQEKLIEEQIRPLVPVSKISKSRKGIKLQPFEALFQ